MRQIVRCGRVDLSVQVAGDPDGDGPRLLLLHALYGSGRDWRDVADAWPGARVALDFSGHGDSDWLPGRGYSPEGFVAEADAVLGSLCDDEPLHVAGAGLGAYVALLLAGARPDRVPAALLLPGEGLAGGGAEPRDLGADADTAWLERVDAPERATGQPGPDPVVARCSFDLRPPDYAEAFARAAGPLLVAGVAAPPPWLAAVLRHGSTTRAPDDPREALRALARC